MVPHCIVACESGSVVLLFYVTYDLHLFAVSISAMEAPPSPPSSLDSAGLLIEPAKFLENRQRLQDSQALKTSEPLVDGRNEAMFKQTTAAGSQKDLFTFPNG